MIKIKYFLVLLWVLMMNTTAFAIPIKLMVFGDSLSVGYHLPAQDAFYSKLQEKLQKHGYDVVVINYSKSGETSAGGVSKLDASLQKKPDAVLLELGINDVLHGIALTATENNLQKIIDGFQTQKVPILLIGMEAPVVMGYSYRQAFKKMYQSLAKKNNLMLYPFFMDGLWNPNGQQKNVDYFLPDGLHPTAQGVEIMTTNILPTVEKFLKTKIK